MKVPCKDCKDRELGCHSQCERYKEYHEYRAKCNAQRMQEAHELSKTYIQRYKNPWRA